MRGFRPPSPSGGIILSGGACLLQPDFCAALLEGSHKRGFNTAIEAACNIPLSFVEKVLTHVDTMLHDHKLTIPERHKKWTGVDKKRVLENFRRAYETFPDIRFHRPNAADPRHQCRRGAHPGGPGVHSTAQERDRL